MSITKFSSSAFTLALICFMLLAAFACNSVQLTPSVTGDSGSLVFKGVTYSFSRDEAGNVVVTTTEGASFKFDANGDVIESTSPGGAKVDIVYQGTNLEVTTFFPEFQNTSRLKTLRMSGGYAAQSVRSICDELSDTCTKVETYLNILRNMQNDLVDSYYESLNESLSKDVIAGVVEAHLQRIRDNLANFCAGWDLALLLNQNPCDMGAGQPCDSPTGAGWLVSENDSALEDPFEMQINGTSATATLTRIRRFTDSIEVVELPLTMTGTLSQGSGGCARCTVFQGTWTGRYDEALDAAQGSFGATYTPPRRTFNIVLAEDNRSFTGNLIAVPGSTIRLAGQRSGCP